MANIHMPKEYSDYRDLAFLRGTGSILGIGQPSVQRWYWSPGVPTSPPGGQPMANPFRSDNSTLLGYRNRPGLPPFIRPKGSM